jgi:hypothetical protein
MQTPEETVRRLLWSVLLDSTFGNQVIDLLWMVRVFLQFRPDGLHLEVAVVVKETGLLKDANPVVSQFGIVHFLTFASSGEDVIRYSRFALAGVAVLSHFLERCLGLNEARSRSVKVSSQYSQKLPPPKRRRLGREGPSFSDLMFHGCLKKLTRGEILTGFYKR